MKAWVAKHTGLPSFAFATTKGAWHVIEARDETGRAWEAVATHGTGSLQILSDPLALPGVETTYVMRGRSDRSVLTRTEVDWWRGMVSRMDGRTIPEMAWVKNGDPRDWKSGVQRFSARAARWPMDDEPITGTGVFALFDPSRQAAVWALLRAHEPLIVAPGQLAPGLPPRVVTVDSVGSTRISGDGFLQFQVDWTEVPLDSPMLRRPDGSRGVGVVNWGEWDDLDHQWRGRTYSELCRLIAGMP